MRNAKNSSPTQTGSLATQLAYGPHITVQVSLADALAGHPEPHEPSPDDPATKLEADYRPAETDSERCGTCRHMTGSRCELVVGQIDPTYVCYWWEAK